MAETESNETNVIGTRFGWRGADVLVRVGLFTPAEGTVKKFNLRRQKLFWR
ncbi:hypothetical protein ACVWZ6_002325 [Bradyrhizobium sp. GM6.1]